MATLSISHFAPILFLYFLHLSLPPLAAAVDVTTLLSHYQDLSSFAGFLSNTSIAADLLNRSAFTILAVPNSLLRPSDLAGCSSTATSGDVLRNQILLEYVSADDLLRIPPAGKSVNTLFTATGRASSTLSGVKIIRDPISGLVSVHSAASNVSILKSITAVPYNVSVFTVDSLLVPCGFDLMASETNPPLGLNITQILLEAHAFNVAAAMLLASGVVEEFQSDEKGAGITLFVPTDDAFAAAAVNLQSLTADNKGAVLKFHVLHSYYPLGSLESIVNPVQPTLATEEKGAGSYTLNISRINGSMAISTGLVQANVTQTVFDQKPVAIFGVSRVLLPREIFGKGSKLTQPPPPTTSAFISPDNSPELYSPPSRISSPPGFREEIKSRGTKTRNGLWSFLTLILILTFSVCAV